MIRVVIAAAAPAVRVGLGALLAANPSFTVLEAPGWPGIPADLTDTVEADVLLVALEPGESLPVPLALPPDRAGREPAVVVLGDDPTDAWATRAIRAGARGALSRTATGIQIAAAVAAAAAGLTVIPADHAPAAPRAASHAPAAPTQALSRRETEVLAMLAEGLGNKVIAARLGISDHTVKSHVAAIFGKLGVSTRAEAAVSAARLGLIML
ncbi:MAG TPA: response regulator transcription factor [Gemmatimonadales bacterium]